MDDIIKVFIEDRHGIEAINVSKSITLDELKKKIYPFSYFLFNRYFLICNGNTLWENSSSLYKLGINDGSVIKIIPRFTEMRGGACGKYEINIKFLKSTKSSLSSNKNQLKKSELFFILKLCLLKEIAYVMNDSEIEKISSKNLMDIMNILKNGLLEMDKNTKKILKKF